MENQLWTKKKNQKTPHTPTDAASHISVTHRDDTDVFTSFQQPFIFDDAPLWPPRPSLLQLGVCVCVQPLTFVFTHNHRACLCPQSPALNAELDTRVVFSRYVSEGEGHEITERAAGHRRL